MDPFRLPIVFLWGLAYAISFGILGGLFGAAVRSANYFWSIYHSEIALDRAIVKGLDHILQAQYPTGGWPQRYPPGEGYQRHVTFNDNTMVRILELLREVAESPDYEFMKKDRRGAAKTAFDAGLKRVDVFVKGPGSGREGAIRALANSGLEVTMIKDVTPLPHNGCRPPKKRRV